MEINFENFKIRRSEPLIAGQQGLPEGHERYIAKGGGLISIDIFSGDEISEQWFSKFKNIYTATLKRRGADNFYYFSDKYENFQN